MHDSLVTVIIVPYAFWPQYGYTHVCMLYTGSTLSQHDIVNRFIIHAYWYLVPKCDIVNRLRPHMHTGTLSQHDVTLSMDVGTLSQHVTLSIGLDHTCIVYWYLVPTCDIVNRFRTHMYTGTLSQHVTLSTGLDHTCMLVPCPNM